MRNMKKTIALALMLALTLVSVAALGAQMDQTLPGLLQAVVDAAYESDVQEIGLDGATMPPAMIQAFARGLVAHNVLPSGSDPSLEEIMAQYVAPSLVRAEDVLDAAQGESSSNKAGLGMEIAWMGEADGKLQVLVELYQQKNADKEWFGDAIVVFQEAPVSPLGYVLAGFSQNSELSLLDHPVSAMEENTIWYENDVLGFAVAYPAVFTEERVAILETGLQGSLADGTAGFHVRKEALGRGDTLEGLIAEAQSTYSGSDVTRDGDTTFTLRYTEDGVSYMMVYVVGEDSLYTAVFYYDETMAGEYDKYAECIENSFVVYEFSVG